MKILQIIAICFVLVVAAALGVLRFVSFLLDVFSDHPDECECEECEARWKHEEREAGL